MTLCRWIVMLCLFTLLLVGCSSGNDPVNLDKDMPKKPKEKDMDLPKKLNEKDK